MFSSEYQKRKKTFLTITYIMPPFFLLSVGAFYYITTLGTVSAGEQPAEVLLLIKAVAFIELVLAFVATRFFPTDEMIKNVLGKEVSLSSPQFAHLPDKTRSSYEKLSQLELRCMVAIQRTLFVPFVLALAFAEGVGIFGLLLSFMGAPAEETTVMFIISAILIVYAQSGPKRNIQRIEKQAAAQDAL